MAKKQVQLQIEVESDEDWENLLQKKGLIVVDVYSEWCGPCSAMQANLKKIKMEYGGDNLVLAVACSERIKALERFRKKSEPTWIFLSGGKLIRLMFGADAPKLTQTIIYELQREVAAKESPDLREMYEVDELTPEEKARFDDLQKQEEENRQREILRKELALRERRFAVARTVINNGPQCGIIVVFPHARTSVVATLVELWEPAQISVASSEKPRFNEAMLEELLYFSEQTFSEPEMEDLLQGQALVYLVKHNLGDEYPGNMDELVQNFVYGEMMGPPGSEGSPADKLQGKIKVEKEVEVEEVPVTSPSVFEAQSQMIPIERSTQSITAVPTRSGLISTRSFARSAASVTNAAMTTKSKSKQSKLFSRMFDEEQVAEEESEPLPPEEEFIYFQGIWAPPNDYTKATAVKILFPKVYDPIALPEPVPTPPHIAIAFDALKRREVLKLASEYPNDVMRYGFFTDDNPEKALLIAKTIPKFEKIRATGATRGEKLVLQLSRKRSDAVCALAQLGPTYMSLNTSDGEEECKLFFDGSFDNIDEEAEEAQAEEGDGKTKKHGGVTYAEGVTVEYLEDQDEPELDEPESEGPTEEEAD